MELCAQFAGHQVKCNAIDRVMGEANEQADSVMLWKDGISKTSVSVLAGHRAGIATPASAMKRIYPSTAGPSNCFSAWTYAARAWRPVSVMR